VTASGRILAFRAVLVAIGVLTVLASSHVLRYGLCGVLVVLLAADVLLTRARTRSRS
jgi:hypothetical protein